jgi:hypothetical protein
MPKDTQQETHLVTQDLNIQLPSAKPEYKSMLANIADKALPLRRRQPTSTSRTLR